MHAIALSMDAVALLSVAAAFGAAAVLYDTWRTRLLRLYLLFIGSISAFAVAMALEQVADALTRLDPGREAAAVLGALALLVQGVGGVVHVAVLPRFTYSINNRHLPDTLGRVFYGISAAMGLIAVVYIVKPQLVWVGYLLTAMLFASVAFCVLRMLPWVIRPVRAAEGLDSSRVLRRFLVLSVLFLPLFAADVVVSAVPAPSWISAMDGTTLPAYLAVLAAGSIAFARRRLSAPALYRDERVTQYCRERFGLTPREAEVVEYAMEGYSVPDLASVLGISAKTAEHHLYSAYRKLAVSNRVQLYNTLMSHR